MKGKLVSEASICLSVCCSVHYCISQDIFSGLQTPGIQQHTYRRSQNTKSCVQSHSTSQGSTSTRLKEDSLPESHCEPKPLSVNPNFMHKYPQKKVIKIYYQASQCEQGLPNDSSSVHYQV